MTTTVTSTIAATNATAASPAAPPTHRPTTTRRTTTPPASPPRCSRISNTPGTAPMPRRTAKRSPPMPTSSTSAARTTPAGRRSPPATSTSSTRSMRAAPSTTNSIERADRARLRRRGRRGHPRCAPRPVAGHQPCPLHARHRGDGRGMADQRLPEHAPPTSALTSPMKRPKADTMPTTHLSDSAHPAPAGVSAPPIDAGEVMVVHSMFRREMRLAGDLVRRVESGDTRRSGVIARHLDLIDRCLHHHHVTEDELVWPLLRARASNDVMPIVDLMESQHHEVARSPRPNRGDARPVGGHRRRLVPRRTRRAPRPTRRRPLRPPRRRGVQCPSDRRGIPHPVGVELARRGRTARHTSIGTNPRARHDAARRRSQRGRHDAELGSVARTPPDPPARPPGVPQALAGRARHRQPVRAHPGPLDERRQPAQQRRRCNELKSAARPIQKCH